MPSRRCVPRRSCFLRRAAAQKSPGCAAKQQISHVRRMGAHAARARSIGTDDPIACLAILFHDVGKKAVRTTGEDGYDHFFGHAEKSAAFTDEALRALHCDNKTRENVVELVLLHDTAFPKRTAKFRRLLAKLGYEQFYRLLAVSRADSLAHAPWCIEGRCKALADAKSEAEALQKADFCLSLRQLKINRQRPASVWISGQSNRRSPKQTLRRCAVRPASE